MIGGRYEWQEIIKEICESHELRTTKGAKGRIEGSQPGV